MKKLLLSIVAVLCAVTASAQEPGGWTLGPRLGIYTNVGDTVLGVGAVGRYRFDNNWRLEPSITALLHKYCSVDISCDAHYVFDLGVVRLYPPPAHCRPPADHRHTRSCTEYDREDISVRNHEP